MKGVLAGFLIPLFLWAQRARNVEFVGNWPFGPARTVAVDPAGNRVFLGAGGGVYVLDVSHPSHPQKISEEIRTREPVMDLFYDESHLLYVVGGRTVEIWDVSDPVKPVKRGEMVLQSVSGIFVAGTLAYVADEERGLFVFDVADPSHPEVLTIYRNSTESIRDVYVAGSFAYVVDEYTGLRVLDVSNPRSLKEAGAYETSEWRDVQDIVVSGSHAYVVDRYAGLRVVDISDPHAPREVGFYDTPGWAEGVDVAGSYAYVADVVGLCVIDISDPSSPKEVKYYAEGAIDVRINGSYAFLVGGSLRVTEISDPDSLKVIGVFVPPGGAGKVQVAGSLAYLGTGSGLYILDVSNPLHPKEVGFYDTQGAILDLEVQERYAYVVVKERGLFVVDVSQPAHPEERGRMATPRWVDDAGVDVSGSYVYLVYGWSLHIVDVSDPFHPREEGVCTIGQRVLDVDVSGSYAYVVEKGGLRIIDVSDPSSPRKMGVYRVSKPYAVGVSGAYAYVVDGTHLRVIDVTHPSHPREAGFMEVRGYVVDVRFSGPYAYVVGRETGFRVVDVRNPSSPVEVGWEVSPANVWDIDGSGSLIFVAAGNMGLQIYRFTPGGK